MAKTKVDKTKPESVMVFTIEEMQTVPGSNIFTIRARSDDPDIGVEIVPVDMTSVVDGLSSTDVAKMNDFYHENVAAALGVDKSAITGDLIVQTP